MTCDFLVTLNWYFWYFPTTPFPPPWVVVSSFKYPLIQLLGAPQSSTSAWCMTMGPRALLNKNPLAVCSKTVSCEWFGVSPLLNQNVGESSRCGSFTTSQLSFWNYYESDLSDGSQVSSCKSCLTPKWVSTHRLRTTVVELVIGGCELADVNAQNWALISITRTVSALDLRAHRYYTT